MAITPLDITGKRYNHLTAVRRIGGKIWLFRCDCGEEVELQTSHAKSGNNKSCGCMSSRREHKRPRDGRSKHPLYSLWSAMIDRCNNPKTANYKRYGGRGIAVCVRWRKFESFVDDMGDRPEGYSLDRKDNDGNYELSNCRWATRDQQMSNTSANVFVTAFGKTQTAFAWEKELGFNKGVVNRRLKRGWSQERALTEPPKIMKSRNNI